jgi:hypothetical protein
MNSDSGQKNDMAVMLCQVFSHFSPALRKASAKRAVLAESIWERVFAKCFTENLDIMKSNHGYFTRF